jgi:hypothetical protein
MEAYDETNITEIELLADGRICVFGTSIEVLEVLEQLQGKQAGPLSARLHAVRSQHPTSSEKLDG